LDYLVSGVEPVRRRRDAAKASQSIRSRTYRLIFGRNVWQHEHTESVRFAEGLQQILAKVSLAGCLTAGLIGTARAGCCPGCPLAGRHYLTMRTGRSLRWMTLCAVLPRTRPARSPRPREPITITPASVSLASATISRAAYP
jgi:hypothetical protein